MRPGFLTLPLTVGLLLPAAAPAHAAHPVTQQCAQAHTSVVFVEDVSGSRRAQYPHFYETGDYRLQHLAPGLGCSIFLERAGITADSRPSLDATGERIVVNVDADNVFGGSRVLQIYERQAHAARRLTHPVIRDDATVHDSAASWSPDGRTVLFTRTAHPTSGGDRTSALQTVPADGGPIQVVPGTEGALSGTWHPDGSRIAFAVRIPTEPGNFPTEDDHLVTSGIDGSARTDLGVRGVDPTWSPDGATLAFSSITDPGAPPFIPPTRRITLRTAPDGAVTVLSATGDNHGARHPAWLPDGQSLVYSQLRSGMDGAFEPGGIWTVDRTGLRSGPLYDSAGDERAPSAGGPRPSSVTAGTPSTFIALTPRRVLDTRADVPVGPGGLVDVNVNGQPCPGGCASLELDVPADASAVVLTVTVVAPTSSTDIAVYPTGGAAPGSSNVNAAAGQTVANAVMVPVGDNGQIRLRNSAGSAHLLVDLAGYFRPGDSGAGFAGSVPRRILDTRSPGNVGAPAGKVGPAQSLDLQVTGDLPHADGGTVRVPADATAVVLNLTATGATAGTDVRAYPRANDERIPDVSNLNLRRGQTAASQVTVPVGELGQIRLRNAGGEVNLIADLAGWYSPSAPGRFVPAPPTRFLDTRTGLGAAPLPLVADKALDVAVAATRGVPAGAGHVVLNLTGTNVSASTDVRAYPADADAVPTVSNLNLTAGATRANLAIVPTSRDGGVRLRSSAGQLAVVADLAGWFVPR